MTKVTLFKVDDPEDDPEIEELVKMTLADMRKSEGETVEIRKASADAEAESCRWGREHVEKLLREKAGAPAAVVRKPEPSVSERLDRLQERTEAMHQELAESEALIEASRATREAIEAEALIAKRDVAGARAIFMRDQRAHDAYMARLRGESYRIPVAKAQVGPDHRAEVRELLRKGDMDGLGALMRACPAAGEQYHELVGSGEAATIAGPVQKRDLKAEILRAHKAGDGTALKRLKATDAGQKAWQDLVLAGKIKLP